MKANKFLIKSLSWLITRNCNYSCNYCISPRKNFSKNDCPDPYLFLDKFKKYLKGSWKVYISGGEPFLAPRFLEIIREISKSGYRIVVMTNLSVPLSTLLEFIQAADSSLSHVSASLHLQFADLDEFFKKSVAINKVIGKKFSVRIVAKPGEVLKFAKIGQKFREKGIGFFLRPEKISFEKTQEQKKYNKRESKILRGFKLHHNIALTKLHSFKGKLCWAGSKYFSINEKGDIWRCHPAEKSGRPEGYLGNLFKGNFKIENKPIKCIYEHCYCAHNIFHKNKLIIK